ncbi:hypothetical protein ABZ630_25060, partial [Streptomyces albidoflavus]|uniref:hypothetical protein n=4 Tax=Streptomyces TaxID=1883 RepID=UPI0033E41F7E
PLSEALRRANEAGARALVEPRPTPRRTIPRVELPDYLIRLQRAADDEGRRLEHLDEDERDAARRLYFNAAAEVDVAVRDFAATAGLDRHTVEKELRQQARQPPTE